MKRKMDKEWDQNSQVQSWRHQVKNSEKNGFLPEKHEKLHGNMINFIGRECAVKSIILYACLCTRVISLLPKLQ